LHKIAAKFNFTPLVVYVISALEALKLANHVDFFTHFSSTRTMKIAKKSRENLPVDNFEIHFGHSFAFTLGNRHQPAQLGEPNFANQRKFH
jgi:urease accessory protein UreE